MSPRIVVILAAALSAGLACGGDDDGARVRVESQGEVDVVPPPTPGEGVRPRRRMDLDQLSASFERVTGGLNWAGWAPYAGTLGKPDYAVKTHEDLTASLLFHKFLDDAARDVCDQLVLRDFAAPRESRILMARVELNETPYNAPDAVRENLSYLLLRFHGRRVRPGDALLDPWERLFKNVYDGTFTSLAGWRAVCVALFEHPDFTSY